MRFVVKERRWQLRIMGGPKPSVETEGYDPISRSSYGPYAKKHGARVSDGPTMYPLNWVRMISPEIDKELRGIENRINALRLQHRKLLDDNFLTFRLAEVQDFSINDVRQGYTKEEAESRLPKGIAAKAGGGRDESHP